MAVNIIDKEIFPKCLIFGTKGPTTATWEMLILFQFCHHDFIFLWIILSIYYSWMESSSPETRNLPDSKKFRAAILKNLPTPNVLYRYGAKPSNVTYARMRMGCGELNARLFRNHVIDSPTCARGNIYAPNALKSNSKYTRITIWHVPGVISFWKTILCKTNTTCYSQWLIKDAKQIYIYIKYMSSMLTLSMLNKKKHLLNFACAFV